MRLSILCFALGIFWLQQQASLPEFSLLLALAAGGATLMLLPATVARLRRATFLVPIGAMFRVSAAWQWPETEILFPCCTERWRDLPAAVLATVDSGVFDPDRRAVLAQHAQLVDMEGAVLAQLCQQWRIPFYAVKGVTDRAGSGDRRKLLAHLDAVSEALADTVWRELPW